MIWRPQPFETLMSLRARIWELQQMRATFAGTEAEGQHVAQYCDRRITEIERCISTMKREAAGGAMTLFMFKRV